MGETDRNERQRARTRSARAWRALLAALAVAGAAAAALACIALSRVPPALTDEAALAALPAGTELLASHERDGGRTRLLEYRYTQTYACCAVERTERRPFRYEAGAWVPAEEPEVLDEREDWSALSGYWTERTEGPAGRFFRLQVTGFQDGALEGEIVYRDGASSWEGPAAEVFDAGQVGDRAGLYILRGSGFFRYNYLRIDREKGLFFDNDVTAMTWTERPTELPEEEEAAQPEALETERTWRIAAAELDVRPEPGPDGASLGAVTAGTALACIGPATEDGWLPVDYNGGMGYVPADQTLEPDAALGVVTAIADLNVRAGPGTGYDRLDTVGLGTRLVCIGMADGWYQVIYAGTPAYVSEGYATMEPVVLPET